MQVSDEDFFIEKNQSIFCYLVELMPIKEYPGKKT